ncbi:LVIVD repeat-containing protein [Streptomyces pristinaespiralis]|uniref:hypothetical protein n=1 Tax=Streptomyces pristinaespiralis TaxID=38300 RepID=UPI0038341D0B
MDTTRRTILRGMAAAPVAATAGGLLLPHGARAAQAAADPMPLDLRVRTSAKGTGTSYPDVIKRLLLMADSERPEERHGLARASLAGILADANRKGRPARPDWPGASLPRLRTSFQWQGADEENSISNDFRTKYWRPQGISNHYTGAGGTTPDILMVSWYARASAKDQGARISIVDLSDPGAPRYRHVLLVEPWVQGRRFTFRPATLHAGGIAWYGNRLYIADTVKGLRVFNTDEMLEVATGARAGKCGYWKGKYYAHRYKYVLPQSRAYDHVAPNQVEVQQRYSQVAVDVTTRPHSLVVSEFMRPLETSSRAVRWNLDPGTGALVPARPGGLVRSVARDRIRHGGQVQGAVSVLGTYYLSASAGPDRYGTVRTWRKQAVGDPPAAFAWHQAEGPEDLSHDARAGVLWSVNEYEGNRYVYSMTL